jgi:hypothetical protein
MEQKGQKHSFTGLCKDAFNRVRNHKNAHVLWLDICALHEGTKSEREERYHIAMRKLSSFELLANENANDMYSRFNILVDEVNGLGLTQISQLDVMRKILSVLPIQKYGHIVTVVHQMDLSTIDQLKYLKRSMLMKCICTSMTKLGLTPKRKTWLSKLVKRGKARPKFKLKKSPQVMMTLIQILP